ncbi:MAG: hypothetical protein WBA00_20675, partial [Rhodococcus sp. (in: high G+C Gram-positive bacteria)]
MTQTTSSGSEVNVRVPVVLAAVGAIALSTAPLAGAVDGGDRPGPVLGAALSSALVWIAVAVVAGTTAVRGRATFAGAFVAAVGVMASGLVVADAQLFARAIDADRLELFRPVSAGALSPGPGAVLVLAGHLVLVAAGVFAAVAVSRGGGPAAGDDDHIVARRLPAGVVVAGVVGALAAAASCVLPAYASTDPVFLAPSLLAGPALLALAGAVSAVTVLVLCAYALSSDSVPVAAGVLFAAALGTAATAAVRLVGALGAGDRIGVGSGPVVGVGGAVVLGVVATAVLRSRPARGSRTATLRSASMSTTRRHVVAGVSTVVTGVAMAASTALPLLDVGTGVQPQVAATRSVAIFALVTVVGGILLFFSEFAGAVRPAVVMIVVGHIALAAVVLQAVVLGVGIDSVSVGPGGWVLVAGVVLGLAALISLGLAGSAERDGIDTSDVASTSRTLLTASGVATGLSVIGLALPIYDIGGAPAGWIGSWPWGWDVWGRLVLAGAVVAAAAITVRARRSRGAALAVGGALAVAGVASTAVVW